MKKEKNLRMSDIATIQSKREEGGLGNTQAQIEELRKGGEKTG